MKCFETFKKDLDRSRTNKSDSAKPEFNIIKEIALLEECKDIRDELNILESILGDQKACLNKLLDVVAGRQPKDKDSVEKDPVLNYYRERSDVNMRIEKVKKMDTDTTTTYASVRALNPI